MRLKIDHKMKLLATITALVLAIAGLFAQSNEVVFRFEHRLGAQPLALDTTVFALPDGRNALLTRAEFYISEIELNAADGSKLPLVDFYMLVNANNPDRTHSAGNQTVSDITGLTLHLGVDAAHNHLDPSAYPAGHPLANQNPTMHWGWTAGYRFMAIEGLLDNNNDGVPETIFQYHNLGDSLYQTVELTGISAAGNGQLLLSLKLDYSRLFDKLDMSGNLTQHGSGPVNATMMHNAATKGFITMSQSSSVSASALPSARISASPNPARSTTAIRYALEVNGSLSLILTNQSGQILRRFDDLPANGAQEIALENIPPGLYRYTFYDNGQLLASKQLITVK